MFLFHLRILKPSEHSDLELRKPKRELERWMKQRTLKSLCVVLVNDLVGTYYFDYETVSRAKYEHMLYI